MKCEEPPKKPDKDGGRGQEEDEQPMPVDDGGEADGEDGDDFTSEEYSALDRQLDSLNSALDAIEQRNDDIHGKLRAVLRENKEARESLDMGASPPVGSGTDSDKGTREVKQGEEPS